MRSPLLALTIAALAGAYRAGWWPERLRADVARLPGVPGGLADPTSR